jgi:ABC-2 type transport system ATP-binding protein
MSPFIIEADHITKRYASHTALDDVSLQIPAGKIFGMLGPNGAGKTTMIRIINQIIAPDQGELKFFGEKLLPKHIESIGYLPEERGLYKKMKVGEQALYLAQLKGLKKSDAREKLKFWFDKFEMDGWWNKKVEELSKGMQQKVQFVTTILHEPKLLILDEPFTGFDPINAALVRDEILVLKEKGTSIIISTHRMESVEELCDYIALINKSKKVLGGSVKEIRKQHKTDVYEVKVLNSTQSMMGVLNSGYKIESTRVEEEETIYKIKIEGGSSNELIQLAGKTGEVHSFKELVPSMNDIFIQTVQNN